MKNIKRRELKGAGELRRKAEERLKSKPALPERLSELETQKLIQELQVHQIELEMQNGELRRVQAVLEESRAKYSDLYDFAPVGYLTLNRQGLILEANLTACSKLGKERSSVINISNLFTNFIIKKEEKDLFYQHLRKVFEAKSLETCELELKGQGDTQFYAQLQSTVVKDDLSQCRTAITDITERKRAEEILGQKSLELERSNKELEDFAYSVSHDLKAPLRGIGQVVEWLHDDFVDKLNDEQKENMNLMKVRVGRMNDLIDGILRYSRLGRSGEVKEKVDLKKLVVDVIDSLQPPKEIEVKIEETLPTLSCVLVQIEQVFQNLIGNAIRYVDKKNGRIKVGCRDNHDDWTFSVEDNGPGIAKEHFEKIFQIFQTLKPRDEVESTGIGLSIVKKLVELHNGRVWLESEMGVGSTFFFSLPKNNNQERKTI